MEDMDDAETPKKAGSIKRITVENFMCHSSLIIELGDRVNFITGQNGSGKSAILTALCVAFGIKAKGTQRANSIKDFIKNDCRYALVVVELNNEGEDAFKPESFGDRIIVERRINESSSTFCLKNSQGVKMGTKKEDILDVVEHFNIEVDNPCVIMTQDKSREFLHGGSDKDKFKFFFKATLLQNVNELLTTWGHSLDLVFELLKEMQNDLEPAKNELKQIEEQLKTLEQVGKLRADIEKLEKIYGWTWVREAEIALRDAEKKLTVMKNRMPVCQKKIDEAQSKVDQKTKLYAEKQTYIAKMIHDTQELRQSRDTLQTALSEVMSEKVQAEEDTKRLQRSIQETRHQLQRLQSDISEMQQRMLHDTQAEQNEKLEEIFQLECNKRTAEENYQSLQAEEGLASSEVEALNQRKVVISKEIDDYKDRLQELKKEMNELQSRQTHSVTAFGGPVVLKLLKAIEDNCARFTRLPLGPIGVHVRLVDGAWSQAVEVAVGMLLNQFVVANQRDTLLLRELGNRVGFHHLGIISTNFDRPRIRPTTNDLPDGSLVTVLAALQSENAIIMNVLIDQGSIDQKVLAEDYGAGKIVAFNGGARNVKEVITKDGTRMYTRAGAETTLFKDRRTSPGRLGIQVHEKIQQVQVQERDLNSVIQDAMNRKRKLDEEWGRSRGKYESLKRKRTHDEMELKRQDFKLRDLKRAVENEIDMNKESSMVMLEQEIAQTSGELESKEDALRDLEMKFRDASSKWTNVRVQLEQFIDAARGDIQSLQVAEEELVTLGDERSEATELVNQFQKIMEQKVVAEIQSQEQIVADLRRDLEKCRKQASEICPEEERQNFMEDDRSRDQLSNQMTRLKERVKKQENETEPEDELNKRAKRIRRRILSREKSFTTFQQKLDMIKGLFEERKTLYRRNCVNLRRELTWGFNGHLGRKGFSGNVKVDYERQTLNMSVQMPQDASNTSVRDTRALSGGERSYSTLAFALAVHNMTEAPFRAMDEFDVFMDAVSRKISLDTVVEFALEEGSQWIFITPHDISMVKGSKHVKKQQMPAPRP